MTRKARKRGSTVSFGSKRKREAARRIAALNPRDVKKLAESGAGASRAGRAARTQDVMKVKIGDKRLGRRTREIMREVGRRGFKPKRRKGK